MIEVDAVTKKFNNNIVLNNISFILKNNDKLALIGPNGSGKSTLLKILLNLIPADSGEIYIKFNINNNIGYVSEGKGLIEDFSVYNYLKYQCIARGIPFVKIDEVLEKCNIQKFEKIKIKKLSFGTKQKVAIAQSLLSEPSLLILDEPANGIDFQSVLDIRKIIYELENTHLIMASHQLTELEKTCNYFLFLKNGINKLFINIRDLKTRYKNIENAYNIILNE